MSLASNDSKDFSLVLGGPLYQILRKAHLEGDTHQLLRRRVLVITFLTWVPLLLLSIVDGNAWGDALRIPFLYDIETHARFLIALPILIGAELIVHQRMGPAMRNFEARGIVISEESSLYREAIDSVMRIRNSVFVEIALLVVVYTVGFYWRMHMTIETESWSANPAADKMVLTNAGYWHAYFSLPFFQFLLLRWYMRFGLWFIFLWKVSRLNLNLIPTHPDRAGGLGFLGKSAYAFGPILFAQGAVISGMLASQIFYAGKQLMDFKVQIAGFVFFFVVLVLLPLTVFIFHLSRAKRKGSSDFAKLAARYSREFEKKWFAGGASQDEALLGSADLQSLADLGNAYSGVSEMRLMPFGLKDLSTLVGYSLLPILPLLLTIFSVEDLVNHVIKVLF